MRSRGSDPETARGRWRRSLAHLLLKPFLSEARRKEIVEDLEELRARRAENGRAALPRTIHASLRYWIDLVTLPLASKELDHGIEATARASARLPLIHRLTQGLDSVLADLRFSVRSYLRTPLASLVILGTIALALGANTAIFSLADALFLRALPVPEPDRLMALFHQAESDPDQYSSFSFPDFLEIQEQNQVLDGVAAYAGTPVEVGAGPEPETMDALIVSGNYFSVLGREPALGRSFRPEEDRTPETHAVAVISHTLWQDRFDGSPSVLGSDLVLNGRPFTVVGVAPEDMPVPDLESQARLWVPLMMHRTLIPNFHAGGIELFYNRGTHWLNLLGRVKEEIAPEAAEASLRTLAREQARLNPDANTDWSIALVPTAQARTGPPSNQIPRTVAGLLAAVVALVLLIACANVANLLMARAEMRRQEMGLRLAMGAGRGRLVRQVLTESALLAGLGAVLGLLLALWSADLLASLGSTLGPGTPDVRLDGRVAGFALALAVVTALAFGALPAFQASTVGATWARRGQTRREGSRSWRFRWKQLLIVFQVALSLVLLVGAGLALRTVWNVQNLSLGFEVDQVSVVSLDLSDVISSEEAGLRAQQRLMDEVANLPGVGAVSLARVTPFSPWRMARDFLWESGKPEEPRARTNVDMNVVGPGYFQALGIPILEGRGFTRDDGPGTRGVAVVNRALAQRLWPDQRALGRSLWSSNPKGPDQELRVVGVVENGRYYRSWRSADRPFLFLPAAHDYATSASLVVRGGGESDIKAAVRETVPGLSPLQIRSLEDVRASSIARERTTARLLTLFGILALAIAAMGIYGVVSFSVSRRYHEIGVRMAVGARSMDVGRIVVVQSVLPVLLGAALGGILALPTARLMAALLFQVRPDDLPTVGSAATILILVGILASLIPAYRATRVDPLKILNSEG